MASASPDNIKQWKFPDGNFIQNMSGHNSIINTLALNQDNVLVSGGKGRRIFFNFCFRDATVPMIPYFYVISIEKQMSYVAVISTKFFVGS